MNNSPLDRLPDELLEAIAFYLPPAEALAFGSTCKRGNKIAYEHLLWRTHCITQWKHWESKHELDEKLENPPAQTQWRKLYNERKKTDKMALETFDEMLKTQQHRIQRMEEISGFGYDVKDMLLKLRDETPDEAEDVLARRWYADALIGKIHRKTAVGKWQRLQKRQMVRLEEVLGSYDLFVVRGKGDLRDLDKEFDRLAEEVRMMNDHFDDLSIRDKATRVAEYLRLESLVGNPSPDDYHALRNNFLSMALFGGTHTSLPLQSVAIYCAVARRLGVNAKPSNYPAHVHAVIQAPAHLTLNGEAKNTANGSEPDIMYMDPWRSAEEMPRDALILRLTQMGVPPTQQGALLGSGNNLEITLRAGRNIMHSVQEERDRRRGPSRGTPSYPDTEAAWYSMLWSMMILGDTTSATTLHRRRQCLPYLVEHFQQHFPEDLGMIETIIAPMFDGESEREHAILLHVFSERREGDNNAKAPARREGGERKVEYKVGQHFQHKRYGYDGVIIGWDHTCEAEPRWMHQMRVDDLPRGRGQPFYNILADDKSHRYVAEENIERLYTTPCETLMQQAGRYFKRWDREKKVFVSNITDAYPDD